MTNNPVEGKSRYRYENRIKELETENLELKTTLFHYKNVVLSIYNGIVGVVAEGKTINTGWVLGRIREIFK